MNTGLLWYDDTPRPLGDRVRDAARRHYAKFGQWPDTCHAPPRDLVEEAGDLTVPLHNGQEGERAVRVVPSNRILVNHLWIGIDEGLVP